MEKIWANRLVAKAKKWNDVRPERQPGVKKELLSRVEKGTLSQEQYDEIMEEA